MVKGSETPYAAIVMTTDCGDLKKVRPGELVEDQSRSRFQAQTTRAVRRNQRRTRRSHLKNWVTLFVVSFKLWRMNPFVTPTVWTRVMTCAWQARINLRTRLTLQF